jgi:hypothetical protein
MPRSEISWTFIRSALPRATCARGRPMSTEDDREKLREDSPDWHRGSGATAEERLHEDGGRARATREGDRAAAAAGHESLTGKALR